ncbi:MAG: hypothetical protein CVV64_11435 [Candidatus Wallbacteria bacterium HGW-Wallbacteria-1]|jgi:WD40 repeat protein|uniref:Uncharacterized protein n=1 Tax=Candidatus Wallbacteria bacterium HGW-Wallbacteria-1 TaxID=2013854 RepID=A0A2N1PNN9_9BACT|nr:MAG: hypothetical protein CVV64_11435 [Candidatus Wallbacteria bacterium HGW-Wallbacteria-1]
MGFLSRISDQLASVLSRKKKLGLEPGDSEFLASCKNMILRGSLSPDHGLLTVTSDDNRVWRWLPGESFRKSVVQLSEGVGWLSWIPETGFALATDGQGLHLLTPSEKRATLLCKPFDNNPFWVCISPNLRYLAMANYCKVVILDISDADWKTLSRTSQKYADSTSGPFEVTLDFLADRTSAGAFSPDSKLLAVGGSNEFIIANAADEKLPSGPIREFSGRYPWISNLCFTGADSLAVVWSDNACGSSIAIVNPDTGVELKRIHRSSTHIHAVTYSDDGKTFITAGNNQKVQMWSAEDQRELKSSEKLPGLIKDIIEIPGEKSILALGQFTAPVKITGMAHGKDSTVSEKRWIKGNPVPFRETVMSIEPPPGTKPLQPIQPIQTVKNSTDSQQDSPENPEIPDLVNIEILHNTESQTTLEINIPLRREFSHLLKTLEEPLELDDGYDEPLGRKPRFHSELSAFLLSVALFADSERAGIFWGNKLLTLERTDKKHNPAMPGHRVFAKGLTGLVINLKPILNTFSSWSSTRIIPITLLKSGLMLCFVRGYDRSAEFTDRPLLINLNNGDDFLLCEQGIPAASTRRITIDSTGRKMIFHTSQDAGAMFHIDEYIMTDIAYTLKIPSISTTPTISTASAASTAARLTNLISGSEFTLSSSTENELRKITEPVYSTILTASLDGCDYISMMKMKTTMDIIEDPMNPGTHLLSLEPENRGSSFAVKWPHGKKLPGRHIDTVLSFNNGTVHNIDDPEQTRQIKIMIELISEKGFARFLVKIMKGTQ